MVRERVPGSTVVYAAGGGPDARSYRVNFDRLRERVPGFRAAWSVAQGIDELIAAFRASPSPVLGDPRFVRIRTIRYQRWRGGRDGVQKRCLLPWGQRRRWLFCLSRAPTRPAPVADGVDPARA
jgi:hypothetical protein